MIGPLEQSLLAAMVFAIMLGFGAVLTPRDILAALRRPRALGIALVAQYVFMPFIAFAMMLALDLSEPVATGLLILSAMPGGPLSTMFTYFSKGNLALSMSATVTATVSGIVMIPIVLSLYASALDLHLPYDRILLTLPLLLVPLGIGMTLRRLSRTAAGWAERLGAGLAVVFIVFLVGSWVPANAQLLKGLPGKVYVAAIALGLLGFAAGYLFARRLRLPIRDARTVALETGIQNAPLAIAVIALSFAPEDQQPVLAVVALYALFIVLSASLASLLFRWGLFDPLPESSLRRQ